MPTSFAKELEYEQDFGPHPIRAPSLGDSFDRGGIRQSAHAVRAPHRDTQLFVLCDVVDDASAAKEDALREEFTDATQLADLSERALDR